MKKITISTIIILMSWLLILSSGIKTEAVQVIKAIPRDRAVDLYWALPMYNADSTLCTDLAGIFLFRSIDKEGPYTLVSPKVFPTSRRWWHDDQKINKVKYYYTMRAVDDVGNLSEYSPMTEVVPSGDDTPPSRVTISYEFYPDSKIGPSVKLTWTQATDDIGIDHYNIYRSLTEMKDEYVSRARKGMPSLISPVAKVDGNTLTFIDKDVKAGTVYYYNVTAADTSDNEAGVSNNITIKMPGVDVTPPIIESVSEDTYNKPKKAGKEITVVLVGEAKLQATYTLGTYAVNQPMKETAKPGTYFAIYTVKPGDNGDKIPVSATLIDEAGNKTEKVCQNTITIDTVPPPATDKITITTGFDTTKEGKNKTTTNVISKVDLAWNKVDSADGYKVYRYIEPITSQNIDKGTVISKKLSKETLTYKDTGATPGKVFYYTVTSMDIAENEAIGPAVQIQVAADIYPPKIGKVVEDTLGVPQKAGKTINVVLYGEPSCIATFDIGTKIKNIPMDEVLISAIHTGTYSAKYIVKEDDDISGTYITGRLKDAAGNEATLNTETKVTIKTKSTNTTPPEIKKVTHNRANYVLVEGEVLKVTVEGAPDCIAFFEIGTEKGTMVKGIKLYQTETKGIYEGSYLVKNGDNIGAASVTAYLADDSGNVAVKKADDLVTIDTSVKIIMTKDPQLEYIMADSTSTVNIVAAVNDAHDNPMEGRKLDFTLISNYGSVTTINAVTDSHGKAYGKYQAGMVVQTAYISAEDVETGIAGITYVKTTKVAECQITLSPLQRRYRTFNGTYYIDMEAHPERITADGNSVSIITSTIRKVGASGIPGPKKSEETDTIKNTDERIAGEKVKFTITSGPEGAPGTLRIHPQYRDNTADGAITDTNGEAKAIYTAGTKIGLVVINAVAPLSAEKGQPIAEMVGLLLIAGEVRYLTIVAQPALLNADGASTSTITVKAEDSFHNPCRDINVNVEIIPSKDATYGTITSNSKSGNGDNFTTKENGETVATYTAGTVPGKVTIRATVYSNTPIDDGLALYQAGKYKEAITIFKAAIAEYPQDNWTDDVYYMLGYSEELINQNDEAITSYNEVVRYYFGGPWADNALYRIGQVYEKKGDYSKAVDAYKELIDNAYLLESKEVYKNDLIDNGLYRLGVMYERLGYYEMAKQSYQELIDKFSSTEENALVPSAEKALEDLISRGY